jgi:hypothetical protein
VIGSNQFAATNYDSDPTALPCNTTGMQGDPGYDLFMDNYCCTYNTDPSVELQVNTNTQSGVQYDYISVMFDRTNTAYSRHIMSTIQFGSGANSLVASNIWQTNDALNPIVFEALDSSQGYLGSNADYKWTDYVENGVFSITNGTAVFDGDLINNNYHANTLPTQTISQNTSSFLDLSLTAGCKYEENGPDATYGYFNLNTNLDLHIPNSCVQAQSGCMDSNAANATDWNNNGVSSFYKHNYYNVDFNQDCQGNVPPQGTAGDDGCCCMKEWYDGTPSTINLDDAVYGGGVANQYAEYVDLVVEKPDFDWDYIRIRYRVPGTTWSAGNWPSNFWGNNVNVRLLPSDEVTNIGTSTQITLRYVPTQYIVGDVGFMDEVIYEYWMDWKITNCGVSNEPLDPSTSFQCNI